MAGNRLRSAAPFGAKWVLGTAGLLGCLASVNAAVSSGGLGVFSAGSYVTPETISLAPSTFGNLGGDYFIPDFNRAQPNGNVWEVAHNGGAPAVFATGADIIARGGLFLPATGWGANSGKFLDVGPTLNASNLDAGQSKIYTFAPDGSRTQLLQTTGSFGVPRLAPAGFGSFGGELVIADSTGNRVIAVSPSATVQTVATGLPTGTGGLAFAPATFGAFGGRLFADGLTSNQIVSIGSDGRVIPFANVPLAPGQTSPFQMEFAPAGFLPGSGSLLFVSIRGSTSGGGTLGDVLAYDASGNLVASLRSNLGLTKFDPRGLLFTAAGNLLISDASDPILIATPKDFAPAPEMPAFLPCVLVAALAMALHLRRSRRSALS